MNSPFYQEYKKLPKQWVYLLSKKDVRELREFCSGKICQVLFGGTAWNGFGNTKTQELWCAGEWTVRGTEKSWRYKLEILGLPSLVVGEDRIRLRDSILTGVKHLFSEYELQPVNPFATSTDLRFFFYCVGGKLQPKFSTEKVDSFGLEIENRKPWWE